MRTPTAPPQERTICGHVHVSPHGRVWICVSRPHSGDAHVYVREHRQP